MNVPTARQQFYQEIHQPQINLAKAALHLAQEEYPQLQIEPYLASLDQMAAEVIARLPAEAYPLKTIQTLNQYLFKDMGFHGNSGQYYDPRNSYLNSVLDRRTGIPITLSLVYLEIAQRIGFPMVGVNMPGHFLIRPVVEEMQVFVDPFHQGEVLFVEDCAERLSQIFGRPVAFRPEFAAAVSPKQLLARILGNLKGIYMAQNEAVRAIATIDLLLMLSPSLIDQRDRGLMHYRLGQWTNARLDLERYLEQDPAARDAVSIRALLQRLQNAEAD